MDYYRYYSIQEFADNYKHGELSRRELLRRVVYLTGGVASAASVLSLLGCGGSVAPASSAANSPSPALARPSTASASTAASVVPSSPPASAAATSAGAAATASGSAAAATTGSAAGSVASTSPSGSAASSGGPAASAATSNGGGSAASSSAPAASAAANNGGGAASSGVPAASASANPSAAGQSGSIAASPAASGPPTSVPAADRNLSAVPNAHSPLTVAPNDPGLDTRDVSFTGNGARLLLYEARPAGASGPLPVVLVVEQNTGLNEHIKDVARRWAKLGYLAAVLDELSRQGGTPAVNPSQIPSLVSSTQAAQTFVGDYKAMVDYYSSQSPVKARAFGINGFCLGGGVTWLASEAIPELKASVPFYGPPPPMDQVKNIKAAVLGLYSADPNDFANRNRDQLDQALTAAGVTHTFKTYPDTRHAFHDDTGGAYNETQALAAWQDATAWMDKYVKAA